MSNATCPRCYSVDHSEPLFGSTIRDGRVECVTAPQYFTLKVTAELATTFAKRSQPFTDAWLKELKAWLETQ